MTDVQPGQSNRPRGAQRDLAVIILAAGRSTRMKTEQPKVMLDICGRPMLSHVLTACRRAGIQDAYVVVGFGKDRIVEAYESDRDIHFVEQREQRGTGHAVSMCADALKDFDGDVVVIAGDMPMIRPQTLRDLIESHRAAHAAASLATTFLDDPTSYGRICRNAADDFEKIVEHRDCTPQQLEIQEVNPSYYCFDASSLFAALPRIGSANAKGEYYITDVLEIMRDDGKPVQATTTVPAADAVGINSRADLAEVARLMQQRIQTGWMDEGVTIVDTGTTWIDSRAEIGPDSVIKPFTCIEGNARIGSGCVVGPYAYVTEGVVVEDGVGVGPGVLNAFDTTSVANPRRGAAPRRSVAVVRQPPAGSGCSRGSE